MAIIYVYHHSDIETTSDNKLKVCVSSESGNTLQIKSDGLYAEQTTGKDGSSGTGYTGHYISEPTGGTLVGYTSPYDSTEVSGRVSGASIIHRIFTASSASDVTNKLRDGIGEYVLAGDIFRVPSSNNMYTYYLVKSTTTSATGKNSVSAAEELGTW